VDRALVQQPTCQLRAPPRDSRPLPLQRAGGTAQPRRGGPVSDTLPSRSDPRPPGLEFVAAVSIPLPHKPLGSGQSPRGTRQLIPFDGGTVRGPGLSGRVLPGGADVQLLRSDGVMEIDAKCLIETETGAGGLYFGSSPSFETAAPELQWLMQHVFVGTASVAAGPTIELRWFKVT